MSTDTSLKKDRLTNAELAALEDNIKTELNTDLTIDKIPNTKNLKQGDMMNMIKIN